MSTGDNIKDLSKVVKFKKEDEDFIAFEVGIQKFNLRKPKDAESTYFVELPITMKGYEWLNRVNEFILQKNPSLERIIAFIEKKFNESNKKQSVSNAARKTLPEVSDLDIDMADLKEERYKRELKEKIDKCKSDLNLDASTGKTPVIFSGKTVFVKKIIFF